MKSLPIDVTELHIQVRRRFDLLFLEIVVAGLSLCLLGLLLSCASSHAVQITIGILCAFLGLTLAVKIGMIIPTIQILQTLEDYIP